MMNEKYEYSLNYAQVMVFVNELCNIKNNNPYFEDKIVDKFNEYVIKRTNEIDKLKLKFPSFLHFLINTNYEISNDVMKYLVRITGKNPFDKENIKQYSKKVMK